MTGDLDADIMKHNPDLDFYLAAPNGDLRVNRNSSPSNNEGSVLLGIGFPRDEVKYKPYPKGHKVKIIWGEFEGPHESLKDLDPVKDDTPPKTGPPAGQGLKRSGFLNGPKYLGYYGDTPPDWIHRSYFKDPRM
ncbi:MULTISPECIES: hypothetical protein [Niastella]|uniref:Uncharacterized protein n=1 Tax=Niastella soli TaxID=2821487 RepID=A0ABS3Z3C0_9BACT|nr:hypothetical protein [Niastella soli]MBO9204667.1 hypothetical protein [Niastella soli]